MSASLVSVARSEGLDPVSVVAPVDETTLTLWNAAPLPRAAAVVRCVSTGDVQAAVRTARALGLPLSVHSGGNDWAGRSVRDEGLVIDLSALDSVEIDTRNRTARIGGGVRSDVLAGRTEAVGLTPVTGTVGLVHMLGLTLGGGYGPLNGRFGLACDNLVSAEVVTATGATVHVDADAEPDLLWALRGGGGNFGVVTSAVVRLHEVGHVHTGMIIYPWTQARSVLTRLGALLGSCPDELSVQTIITCGPDGEAVVIVMPTWSGPLEQGPSAVEPLERLGDPVSVQVGPSSWQSVIAAASESFPPGRHVRIRTRNVPAFSAPVVERLVEAGTSWTSPWSALSIHPFHGAATRLPVGGACFGERRPHQMIEIVGMGENGNSDAAWADRVHASLADEAMPGGYVNLLSAEDTAAVRDAYGPYADRLLAIKARVDPTGVFSATPLPDTAR